MLRHSNTVSIPVLFLNDVREAANTNCIVFGLIGPWFETTIYRTRDEHANHYTTDAVSYVLFVL